MLECGERIATRLVGNCFRFNVCQPRTRRIRIFGLLQPSFRLPSTMPSASAKLSRKPSSTTSVASDVDIKYWHKLVDGDGGGQTDAETIHEHAAHDARKTVPPDLPSDTRRSRHFGEGDWNVRKPFAPDHRSLAHVHTELTKTKLKISQGDKTRHHLVPEQKTVRA